MSKHGKTKIKASPTKPPFLTEQRRAYVVVLENDGWRLGIAVEGEAGYHKIREGSDAGGVIGSKDEAEAVAKAYNERLGISEKDAAAIMLSSVGTQMREQKAETEERRAQARKARRRS